MSSVYLWIYLYISIYSSATLWCAEISVCHTVGALLTSWKRREDILEEVPLREGVGAGLWALLGQKLLKSPRDEGGKVTWHSVSVEEDDGSADICYLVHGILVLLSRGLRCCLDLRMQVGVLLRWLHFKTNTQGAGFQAEGLQTPEGNRIEAYHSAPAGNCIREHHRAPTGRKLYWGAPQCTWSFIPLQAAASVFLEWCFFFQPEDKTTGVGR